MCQAPFLPAQQLGQSVPLPVFPLEATLSYPGGAVVQRSYTPRRQLQQTSYLGAVVETRTNDAAGRHATSTYANVAVTTNSYRLDNLLASRATSHLQVSVLVVVC
ncbi:MAG: hypothetical protein ACK493_10765 [Planctomycetota bacterium]|nr:hypothetical protein [Blastopirellula sp.]